MNNIAKTFEHIFDRTHSSVATIISDYGSGRYEAQTEAGHKLIITGQANVGDKVLYDVHEKNIIEQLPPVSFDQIPV